MVDKGTLCGRDGPRAQQLVDMLGGAASAIADPFLYSITKVVNLLLGGKYGWSSIIPNLLGYIMVTLFFGLAKVFNKVTP